MISFRKIIAGLLAAAITAFSCPAAVFAEDDTSAEQEITTPKFVTFGSTDFTMRAGTRVAMPVSIVEKDRGSFSFIQMSVSCDSKEITIDTTTHKVEGKEDVSLYTSSFDITAPLTAAPEKYDISVKVDVYDMNHILNDTYTFAYSMKVTSDLDVAGLTIVSCVPSKDLIKPGDAFDLVVTLKNATGVDIKDAEVELTDIDKSKFVLDKGFTKQYVNVENGRTGTVKFSLIAQNGLQYIRETLGLTLTYTLDKNKEGLRRSSSTSIILKCQPDAEKEEITYGVHDLTMTGYNVSSSEIKDGTKFTLTVEVKNAGSNNISSARVSISADGTKFALDKGLGYNDFSIKSGESKKFSFSLIGTPGISSVRESVPVILEFGSQSSTVYASVICVPSNSKASESAGKYDLTMSGYSVSVPAVGENTVFDLTLSLKNTSNKNIEKARISLQNLDGQKFAANGGLTYTDMDLAAGETKTATFSIIGCKGISSVREVIPIELNFGEISSTVYATITCVPKASEGTDEKGEKVFAPNIIIENYTFGGEYVTAGQQFPLFLTIKNTSSSATIENLKVTINGGASVVDGSRAFSPANSSNSFFFEKLGMKQTENINIDLLAKADAAPNSYPVEISFSYEYSVGKERYEAPGNTETLTIPLRQEDRLSVNDPELPGWSVNVGEMVTLNTSAVNKGKSSVYNVTVTVEGDGFTCETPSYYIGNIASGTEEYYDAKLTPISEGDVSGELVFTYEDANGEAKEIRKPFTFSAMSFDYSNMGDFGDGMFGEDGMMPEAEAPQEGFPLWAWFAIGGGAAVIIVVVIIIIVKAKKKKAAELEDDDEDL